MLCKFSTILQRIKFLSLCDILMLHGDCQSIKPFSLGAWLDKSQLTFDRSRAKTVILAHQMSHLSHFHNAEMLVALVNHRRTRTWLQTLLEKGCLKQKQKSFLKISRNISKIFREFQEILWKFSRIIQKTFENLVISKNLNNFFENFKKYFPMVGGAYGDARMPNWPHRYRTPLPRITSSGCIGTRPTL